MKNSKIAADVTSIDEAEVWLCENELLFTTTEYMDEAVFRDNANNVIAIWDKITGDLFILL